MDPSLKLPDDLVEFLVAGSTLIYDPRSCECGQTRLKVLDELSLFPIAVTSEGTEYEDEDPHAGEQGAYLVPVVSLLAECEGFSPFGILVWIPSEQVFGTWDSDHWQLIVFEGASWSDIVAEPVRYLNAQWWLNNEDSGCAGKYAAAWVYGSWKAGKARDVWPLHD